MKTSGSVFVWGDGFYGKLGNFQEEVVGSPYELSSLENMQFSSVCCGPHNSAFIDDLGQLLIMGCGMSGYESSIIIGSEDEKQMSPLSITLGEEIHDISVGNYHIVALSKGGTAYTWGWGGLGQLGHGTIDNVAQPKRVPIKCVKQVSSGTKFTILLTDFGELYAFGNNDHGQLGVGNTINQLTPTRVKKVDNITYISCGVSHALAIDSSKRVWLWGQVSQGKIQTIPIEIEFFKDLDIWRVACGEWQSMALTQYGRVYTWGMGEEPTLLLDLLYIPIRQIRCGSFHMCATDDNGKLYTWGRGSSGQLGREGDKDLPIAVDVGDKYISYISCGDYHNVAVTCETEFYNLCFDLLSMEREYVSKLHILQLYYYDPLKNFQVPERRERTWSRSSVRLSDVKGALRSPKSSPSKKQERVKINAEVNDLIEKVFGNFQEILSLHKNILLKFDEACDSPTPNVYKILQALRMKIEDFGVYIRYGDGYNNAISSLIIMMKENELLNNLISTQSNLASEFYSPPSGRRSFSLLELLIEPIKHMARYTRQLSQLLEYSSDKILQNEIYYAQARFNGILERVCVQNFNLVHPTEILTSTLNEYGHPEIGGGRLEVLVERLTHHQFIDMDFLNAFLLTFRLFTNKETFLELLIARYYDRPVLHEDDEMEVDAVHRLIQQRVMHVLQSWIKSRESGYDFEDRHSDFVKQCTTFLDGINDSSECAPQAKSVLRYLQSGNAIAPMPPIRTEVPPRRDTSLNLGLRSFDPQEIADYFAWVDYDYFRRIHPKEFLRQGWEKSNSEELAPNIVLMTRRFNLISEWTIYEIVCETKEKERSANLLHMILVAKCLLDMKDYNGVAAILGGINNTSATRLKKTFSKLTTKYEGLVTEMTRIFLGDGNFSLLRQLSANIEPPSIPYLRMFDNIIIACFIYSSNDCIY
eukprot:TRINITY_DN3381_c0_g1_i1.p1 TRINITY_DN3381_c0_g1~~TRINITY_DN3381_c0_g1_i1.p1  ORF type:complete len:927 (+),score=191.93 TRINITY_DN3381_c0_g1_i1:36-2816(+)